MGSWQQSLSEQCADVHTVASGDFTRVPAQDPEKVAHVGGAMQHSDEVHGWFAQIW